jgi:hypothetical protein
MPDDRRLVFMKKWFERGQAESDLFDQFFSLWICLIVAAQREWTSPGSRNRGDTDRQKVRAYCQRHAQEIVDALGQNPVGSDWLAKRRGKRRQNPMVDTGSSELQQKFAKLSEHLAGRPTLSSYEVADYTAEFLNKIRNNVFHAAKDYEDHDDLALLQRVNPILVSILRRAEPTLAAVS